MGGMPCKLYKARASRMMKLGPLSDTGDEMKIR